MIDMVFLLLIFFLLTSYVILPSIQVNLPEAQTARIRETPDLSLTIREDGSLYLNEESISKQRLEQVLREAFAQSSGEARRAGVVIQSDRGVSFGFVVEIMDLAKKAGAEDISFLVEGER
jgi:biopolymer transport protein ExbD